MGARRSPARPMVMAPATATWHVAPAPRARTSSATAALSTGGSVLGMATTAVNPPSAAARAPVSTVSASSAPGWRRWVCRSTRPGATRQPPASSTVAPRGHRRTRAATSTTSPPSHHDVGHAARPRRRRRCRPGSRRGASARSRPAPRLVGSGTDDGPEGRGRRVRPGRRARSHLPCPSSMKSTAMRTATPLDTWRSTSDCGRSATSSAISTPRFIGPGCMTRASSPSSGGAPRRQPVPGAVLAHRGQEGAGAALGLQAQQVAARRPAGAPRRGRTTPWRPATPRATAAGGCPAPPGSPRHRARRGRGPASAPPGCGGRRPRWRTRRPAKHSTPASSSGRPARSASTWRIV